MNKTQIKLEKRFRFVYNFFREQGVNKNKRCLFSA